MSGGFQRWGRSSSILLAGCLVHVGKTAVVLRAGAVGLAAAAIGGGAYLFRRIGTRGAGPTRVTLPTRVVTTPGSNAAPAAHPADSAADRAQARPLECDLATKLLADQADRDPGKNLVLSPHAALSSLALIASAAEGESRQQLLRALGVQGVPEDLNAVVRQMDEVRSARRGNDPDYTHVAGVWARTFRPEFRSTSERLFSAPRALTLTEVSNSAQFALSFRRWLDDTTRGRGAAVRGTWPERDGGIQVTGALHYADHWSFLGEVHERAFSTATGKHVRVPFVTIGEFISYAETPTVETVRLQFLGRGASAVFVLPKTSNAPSNASSALLSAVRTFCDSTAPTKAKNLYVALPMFHLTALTDLTERLRRIGVTRIFEEDAELRIASATPQWISSVMQAVDFEVNEHGLARSDGAWGQATGDYIPRDQVIMDRPFAFLLLGRERGQVLYAGWITDPTGEGTTR